MKNNALLLHSLGHALLVLLYTSGVAWGLFNSQQLFGSKHTFLVPLVILLLFVLSASIVGALVLGRPVMLYIDGFKREALQFFGCTVSWIAVLILMVLLLYLRV